MNPILLTPFDVAIAAVLIVLDGVLSLLLRLGLHTQLAWAATRLVVQLVLIGFVLRLVFAIASPLATLAVILVMVAIAGREVAARPEQRLGRFGNYAVGASAVAIATFLTAILALTTAIRPQPWYDARYAIPLAGIILGNVLNGGSLALDSLLGGVVRERAAIEAQLALGAQLQPRDARADPRLGAPRAAADHQPDVGRRRGDIARHHDRPDPRRHGPDGGGQIPDPADLPAVRWQWPCRRRCGLPCGNAIDR